MNTPYYSVMNYLVVSYGELTLVTKHYSVVEFHSIPNRDWFDVYLLVHCLICVVMCQKSKK